MKEKVRIAIMLLLGLVMLASLVLFGREMLDYRQGDAIYEEAAETFVKRRLQQETPLASAEPEPEPVDGPGLEIDFEELWAVNEDVIAWVYAADTAINYPVLRGVDNALYLNTSYDKRKTSFGSIFLDMKNAEDFSDSHSIIYGHNMKNGSMFGGLKRYRNQDYFAKHPEIYLITPSGWVKYQVFSAHTTTTTGGVYLRQFTDEEEQTQWLELLQKKSNVRSEITPTLADKVITLSTCTSARLNDRFVVHAMLVEDRREAPQSLEGTGAVVDATVEESA